jgi:hypothetical protein
MKLLLLLLLMISCIEVPRNPELAPYNSSLPYKGLGSVKKVSTSHALLEWQPEPMAMAYTIYIDEGAGFVVVDTVRSTENQYYVRLVDPSRTYKFKIQVHWRDSSQDKNENILELRPDTLILKNKIIEVQSINGGLAFLTATGRVITWFNQHYYRMAKSKDLSSGVVKLYSNSSAFAALKSDGSVVTWGSEWSGGDISNFGPRLTSGVQRIYSNNSAFAALKSDGSVVTWGDSNSGGDSSSVSSQLVSGVQQIYSTHAAFAALKSDGSVVTWGNSWGGGDSSSVSSQLASGVQNIYPNNSAFAALKSDGSVVTWGPSTSGGDSSAVASQLTSGVQAIYGNSSAFAALKSDGSVVTWGDNWGGGDSSSVSSQLASGVQMIYPSQQAFAALKSDGSVVTWGSSWGGGDSSSVSSQLASGVQRVYFSHYAFVALKLDGSVVTWGAGTYGGDSSSVGPHLASGVQQIYSNGTAFAAHKLDGSVVAWGYGANGLSSDFTSSKIHRVFPLAYGFILQDEKNNQINLGEATLSRVSNFTEFFKDLEEYQSSSFGLTLKNNGNYVFFPHLGHDNQVNEIRAHLSSNVQQVVLSENAIAILKNDGAVAALGDPSYGGDVSWANGDLSSNVIALFSAPNRFWAHKSNGELLSWGWNYHSPPSIMINNINYFQALYPDSFSYLIWNHDLTLYNDNYGIQHTFSSVTSLYKTIDDSYFVSSGALYRIHYYDGSYNSLNVFNVESIVMAGPAWYYLKMLDQSYELFDPYNQLPITIAQKIRNTQAPISMATASNAFALLFPDGSVATTGEESAGGDSSKVAKHLRSGVVSLHSSDRAFAVLKEDGSVVVWGDKSYGGDISDIRYALNGKIPVVELKAYKEGFTVKRADGSSFGWGSIGGRRIDAGL